MNTCNTLAFPGRWTISWNAEILVQSYHPWDCSCNVFATLFIQSFVFLSVERPKEDDHFPTILKYYLKTNKQKKLVWRFPPIKGSSWNILTITGRPSGRTVVLLPQRGFSVVSEQQGLCIRIKIITLSLRKFYNRKITNIYSKREVARVVAYLTITQPEFGTFSFWGEIQIYQKRAPSSLLRNWDFLHHPVRASIATILQMINKSSRIAYPFHGTG